MRWSKKKCSGCQQAQTCEGCTSPPPLAFHAFGKLLPIFLVFSLRFECRHSTVCRWQRTASIGCLLLSYNRVS